MCNTDNQTGNRYRRELEIPCFQTDSAFLLKPAAFMDLAQEMAYHAATRLGFGYDDLQIHHTAWVLSRMHFKFNNPPKWRDAVTLYTWHKGTDGLYFLRDFELRSAGDSDFADKSKVLVSCTSSWIVMDTETRRLVRSEDVLNMIPSETQCCDNAIEQPSPKVVMPRGVEPEYVGDHKVAYSDVDIIGHTNNARYIVLAMDCIDYGTVSQKPVKDVCIVFSRETKPGETISLYRACEKDEQGTAFTVEGKVEGKSCFCARIAF
ncbi:MAG: acyl-[acyl-carrier-protein] thioesterase [Candidatus Cryptobacteroides sp.]